MTILPAFLSNVSVTKDLVPTSLDGATSHGVLWQATVGRFLLDVPDVARYLVKDGTAITIDPAPVSDNLSVEHFLRMTPLSALLYQRGICAFHAAVVANGQGAMVLAGESGVGKSTLLTALLQRGWLMLADDLAIVALDRHGQATIHPSYPDIALWPGTLDRLEINSKKLNYWDANRIEYSLPEQFDSSSQPLKAIYWLGIHSKNKCELVEFEGSDRFRVIGTLQYNSHIADALFDRAEYMRYAATIAQSVSISRLRRPRGVWSVDELADLIESMHKPTE